MRELHQEHQVDLLAAREAIHRATLASWWEWDGGSRPFHWRWPRFYQPTIRDGLKVHFLSRAPVYQTPQPDTKDPAVKTTVKRKLSKIRERAYLVAAFVVSFVTFFHVAKGENDIWMVYDGTKCGLNDAIWVPSFWLPTIYTFLRMVMPNTWMSDNDIEEMFHNFILHGSLQPFCGVDLTHYFPEDLREGVSQLIEVWTRVGMGFRWSPYQCCQGMMVLDEQIGGCRFDVNNVFRWDVIRLNLPGSPDYTPSLPWVSKVRLEDGNVAADRSIFVDDIRVTGNTQEEAWAASRRVGSVCSYHGIQDSSRKRRQVSQEPGAWAGSVVWARGEEVILLASDDKWLKTQDQISELYTLLGAQNGMMPRGRLEEIRGFLVHMSRTYNGISPYLNGLHLTIDGWRDDRDERGWRKKRYTRPDWIEGGKHEVPVSDASYRGPEYVKSVPRLERDIKALTQLTLTPKPPLVVARSIKSLLFLYGFGDASGSGFGFLSQFGGSDTITYEYGQWPCTVASETSSNYKEFTNMVDSIEGLALGGQLYGVEAFCGVDNMFTDTAFYKGYSTSEVLDAEVLRLRTLELTYGFKLHMFHIAGTRMIATGTDGVSRGDKTTGAMIGKTPGFFHPLTLDGV